MYGSLYPDPSIIDVCTADNMKVDVTEDMAVAAMVAKEGAEVVVMKVADVAEDDVVNRFITSAFRRDHDESPCGRPHDEYPDCRL